MALGKLFHLLITLKLKKFFPISKLHSFHLRFILHVENLVSRWAVSTDLVNHYHAYGESSLSTPGTLWVSLLIISEISCSDTVSHILFSCGTGLVGLTIHSFHPCLSLAANSFISCSPGLKKMWDHSLEIFSSSSSTICSILALSVASCLSPSTTTVMGMTLISTLLSSKTVWQLVCGDWTISLFYVFSA